MAGSASASMLLLILLVAAGLPQALAQDAQDDCGSGGDAPDGNAAAPVEEGSCTATFGVDDERDLYAIHAPHGTTLTVTVEPHTQDQRGVACLYPPGWNAPTTCAGTASGDSYDPRAWTVLVYLCSDDSCARFGRGDYTLTFAVDGEPSPVQHEEGRVQVGAPTAPHVARTIGPDAPSPVDATDGFDGRWHALARTSTQLDFVRVASPDCEDCLQVRWRFESGSVHVASCAETPPDKVDCRTPQGATHVLVSAREGVDVGYSFTFWHTAA